MNADAYLRAMDRQFVDLSKWEAESLNQHCEKMTLAGNFMTIRTLPPKRTGLERM